MSDQSVFTLQVKRVPAEMRRRIRKAAAEADQGVGEFVLAAVEHRLSEYEFRKLGDGAIPKKIRKAAEDLGKRLNESVKAKVEEAEAVAASSGGDLAHAENCRCYSCKPPKEKK